MKKLVIWTGIALAAIAIIMLRSVVGRQPEATETPTSQAKPVQVTQAQIGTIDLTLDLSGTIEAQTKVSVHAKVPGEVIEFYVDEGDRVTKGDTLAVIDHQELQLQKRQAEAAHRAAQTVYEQATKLAKIRVEAQVAQARAGVAAAEASMQQVIDLAKTRTLSQMEQAEAGLASLQANLEKIRTGAREEDRKTAQAAVRQAQANLVNTQNNYERMKDLFESGAISVQSFEATQTQMEIAQAQYETTQEQQRLIENGAREEDIRAMEAQVRQAETALKLARTQTETRSWEKDVALAESQVATAQAAFTSAEAFESARSWDAEIIGAETAMEQAKVSLDLAAKHLDDATITAPISGIISYRSVDTGGMAVLGAPLLEIVGMDTVVASARVIETDLQRLAVHQPAQVVVEGIPDPFVSELHFMSPTLDPSSRTGRIEALIDNPEMKLKPGMFAKIQIPIEVRKQAVLIPRSALLENSITGKHSVFIVESGKSKERGVDVGLSKGDVVEIRGGLQANESVIIAGQHSLRSDELVNVVNQ